MIRILATFVFVAVSSLTMTTGAWAQAYPTKPIKFIVTNAAGSTPDASASLVADEISRKLGQPVVVENRPAANGRLAVQAVTSANPDGYTLLFGGVAQTIMLPLLEKDLPYDAIKELRMISAVSRFDLAIGVASQSEYKTLGDLNRRVRNTSPPAIYATAGVGPLAPIGLAAMVYTRILGGKSEAASYQSGPAGIIDLVSGRLDFAFMTVTDAAQFQSTGKLRVLAVASADSSKWLPGVPTFAEAGLPEFQKVSSWGFFNALMAPKNTPTEIVDKLNRAINEAFQEPEFKARLESAKLVNMTGRSAAAYDKYWNEEYDRYQIILKQYDLTIGSK